MRHPKLPLGRFLGALAVSALVCLAAVLAARADPIPDPDDWNAVLKEAEGQTVYFHAWGGGTEINDYIAWAADEVASRFGIELEHVKITDTAIVTSQVLAEKSAGRDSGGSVDLVWINGENFAAMKSNGLLASEGWADKLPNWQYVDVAGKPTVISDFTIATDGLEAPWGMAQLVFAHDTAVLADPPRSAAALLEWAKANPGRFAYPAPPDFLGSTFLKQILIELADDRNLLSKPASDEAFAALSAKLFAYLDELHPVSWRSGAVFPENYPAVLTLFADSEIDIAFAVNPAAASNAIAAGDLPDTVRTYIFDDGTIGNSHFVAIPFNANAAAGALVVANFLMSPEAQARKQDPALWGDPTVLDVENLPDAERALFDKLKLGIATLPPEAMSPTLPEPHPSWMTRLEEAWLARYGIR